MTRHPSLAAVLTFVASIAAGGPLDPPAGPITSTYKTLTEVEPRIAINQTNTPGDAMNLFRITEPGSYYLTETITVISGKHGIEIAAAGTVTIDLRGFELGGSPGFNGIYASRHDVRITIRDGTLRGWRNGIVVDFSDMEPCLITGVSALDGASAGFVVSNATMVDCTASGGHADYGFNILGSGSQLRSCTACDCTGIGFSALPGVVMTDCSARLNGIIGFFGFGAFSNCRATNNGSDGFWISGPSTLTGCYAAANGGVGYWIAQGSVTLATCSAAANLGIAGFLGDVNAALIARGCVSADNAGAGYAFSGEEAVVEACVASDNQGDGIAVVGRTNVRGCTGAGNGGSGIVVREACVVSDNTASGNGVHGISATNDTRIVGNTCDSNGVSSSGGAGIRVTGTGCRVDSNNLTDSDIGLEVTGTRNFIVRNSAQQNTSNYVIGANNADAQILSVGSQFVTTDPWANFAF